VLYPDAAVSSYLREHYILYWQTVRPVPRVTIDFGDGRRIETTITGNSIHYVLDSEGQPLEALPGMSAPQPFLRWLTASADLAKNYTACAAENRAQLLRDYHRAQLEEASRNWDNDMLKASSQGERLIAGDGNALAVASPVVAPASTYAQALKTNDPAGGKPLLEEAAGAAIDWKRLALLHQPDTVLDSASLRVIETKEPTAWDSSVRAVSKSIMEAPALSGLMRLRRSLAEDVVYNEYVFHSQIHRWFMAGEATANVDALNEKVYAELFLTPDSDPWLGLLPRGAFTGLPYDGVVLPSEGPARPAQFAVVPAGRRQN
jgi:hypothetical protein